MRARGRTWGVDARTGGWDIRGRWFGVLAGATPRLGELPRGQTIPWRVIAAQTHHATAAARADQMEVGLDRREHWPADRRRDCEL